MVRIRQLLDRIQHRLLFIPLLFVAGATTVAQLMLLADRRLDNGDLPRVLETTVDGGRAILASLAGGLIAAITLLLSLMLVAVQLAASQFSPRTIRDWLGNRTQQLTIGIVLGTTVYCLLILRETRALSDTDTLVPHLSVILAVLLGIVSLITVVVSVDRLTDSLRIGSVAERIMKQTVSLIEKRKPVSVSENPSQTPAAQPTPAETDFTPPDEAQAIVAPGPGWIQQIEDEAILNAMPEGSTAFLPVAIGGFVLPRAPLVWLWPPVDDDHECVAAIRSAFALGDTRTMQQDVGFGILQMVDIALRALSPGINDPNTANDIIAHMGAILLAIWEHDMGSAEITASDRRLIRHDLDHADYAHAAFDQIRRYGAHDPEVAATLIRTLVGIHSEAKRRKLRGPLEPLESIIAQTLETVDASDMSERDKEQVRALRPHSFA